MENRLNTQNVTSLCKILADTNMGLTEREIRRLLEECQIVIVDRGGSSNGYVYKIGMSKKEWLYKCFAEEVNSSKSFNKIYLFIQKALYPGMYTRAEEREKYKFLFEEVNKILVLVGLEVTKQGELKKVVRATSIDEADRRVSKLERELYNRKIHAEVRKYCIKDYLQEDYHAAVFEASKGLAQRVREITGLELDGGQLFQTAFSTNNPCLCFNGLKTENERTEFIGLKELLQAVFHLVRNPEAHTPKINWTIDETKALDVLTIISFAHKYLDLCHKIPGK